MNDWKFQKYWNKPEWVSPRSCSEGESPFCVSSKKFHVKDIDKNSHWVDHLKLKPFDLEDLYKIKIIINKIEAGLTETTI